jgi:hypothetical protein
MVVFLLTLALGESFYREVLLPSHPSWLPLAGGGLAVLAFLGIVWKRRWLYQLLSSVRASVIILMAFTLACLAGSFILQERDLEDRGIQGEKAYQSFKLAEAGFVYHLLGGGNVELSPSANDAEYFKLLQARFGKEFADRRGKMFRMSGVTKLRDQEIQALAERHDTALSALWTLCRYTRLGDVHRSWWFTGLMFLLGVSLLAGTAKHLSVRLTWSHFVVNHLGFLLNHLGFSLLILGFAVSIATEQRGMAHLQVGKSLHEIQKQGSERPLPLGFQLTLEDFFTEYHHEIFVQFLDVDPRAKNYPSGLHRSLKAHTGKTYELWEGKYRITVLDSAEYGSVTPQVVSGQGQNSHPAIELSVKDPKGPGASGWLFARRGADSYYNDPQGGYSLSFSPDEHQALIAPAGDVWGVLHLKAAGFEPHDVPVKQGAHFEYAGHPFRIAQIAQDFSAKDTALASQAANQPAVLLEIGGDSGEPAQRWSFAWINLDGMHKPPFAEIEIQYDFSPAQPDPTRAFRLFLHKGELQLARFDPQGTPKVEPLLVGKDLPLGVDQLYLKVETFHPSAVQTAQVTPMRERDLLAQERAGTLAPPHTHDSPLGPLPPGVGRKFLPPGPPAVKLRIEFPGGQEERWFLSGDKEAGRWSDGTLGLSFSANVDKVKEWRSLLVASDGQKIERQVVRVNSPMNFKGWTLYQNSANPKFPTYSGIMAVRDPGWYLIEPACYLLSLGVMFLFWIKPWLRHPLDTQTGDRPHPGSPRAPTRKTPSSSPPSSKNRKSRRNKKSRKGGRK